MPNRKMMGIGVYGDQVSLEILADLNDVGKTGFSFGTAGGAYCHSSLPLVSTQGILGKHD